MRWSETRPRRTHFASALPLRAAFGGFLAGVILGFEPVTAVGLGLVGFTAAWYLVSLGEEIAVVPLAAFIASAQWILGPVISYRTGDPFSKYRMYVPEGEYMNFVVPALLGFIVAIGWIAPRISIQRLQVQILGSRLISERVVFGLISTGLLADYFAGYSPSGLRFVFFLLGQFKYVGAIYLIVIHSRYRWPVAGGVMLLTAISAAGEALFHDLILWLAMMLTFICYDFRLKIWSKFLIIVVAVNVLVGLQTVKAEYRNLLDLNPEAAGLTTLISAIGEATFSVTEKYEDSTNSARLNQGWIISAVMAHTPNGEPFADGETIIGALKDSLLPRFLFDKRSVEVSEYYRRFTGLSVGQATSFGVSIVGEAWANFGHLGIGLMFAWGAIFGGVVRFIDWRSRLQPTFALWTPLIFVYAVKAETELAVAMNHIVKASIFVVMVYMLTWRFLRIRI